MFFASGDEPDLVVSTGFAVLRPKSELIDPRYLYACVFDRTFTHYLVSREKGAAYPSVLPEDIADATIILPPLPEQRAIAHILGTLDGKIELNRRMSETLKQMARALFKAWFMDFEPVRAKMEGRWRRGQSLPGLPAHLYDLFPDRLVDSELGRIPEGWEACPLGDLLELAYGKALKEQNRKPGDVPVYGSNGQVGWHDGALVTGPGIIVGRKGNPGIVTWVPTGFFAIDTTFYVVPKEKCPNLYFLFYALSGHDLPSLAADSAVPGLNRNFVYSTGISHIHLQIP
jgi:type I restriction enzyme S subunit